MNEYDFTFMKEKKNGSQNTIKMNEIKPQQTEPSILLLKHI